MGSCLFFRVHGLVCTGRGRWECSGGWRAEVGRSESSGRDRYGVLCHTAVPYMGLQGAEQMDLMRDWVTPEASPAWASAGCWGTVAQFGDETHWTYSTWHPMWLLISKVPVLGVIGRKRPSLGHYLWKAPVPTVSKVRDTQRPWKSAGATTCEWVCLQLTV